MRIRLRLFCLSALTLFFACDTRRAPADPPAPHGRTEDIALAADFTRVSARVVAGATLSTILRAQNVAVTDVEAIVRRAAAVFDVRKVRKDQPYRIEKRLDGSIRRFEYEIDGDKFLRIACPDEPPAELVASVLPIEKTRRVEVVKGQIDRETSSLVAAIDAADETIDLTLALADLFSGDIDFNTDLQPGDHFELLVEKQFRDPDSSGDSGDPGSDDAKEPVFAGYGAILAAEFENDGHRFRAVRYTPEGGEPAYFDERGTSMKRFFLKSPLKFDPVVTSAFSRSRLHPVLNSYRAHLGVDYRAPAGSPVVAMANGTVVTAGTSGGSGRMVHLRHANGYETMYLHLSSIAVRSGEHVRQGALIGRVGAPGLATGPHLDYRLKKSGVFVNPVAEHKAMPPPEPIPEAQITAFSAERDRLLAQLSTPAVANAADVSKENAPVK